MDNSYRNLLNLSAYIDESVDSLDSKNPHYVLCAIILLGNVQISEDKFFHSDLKLGFKASKYCSPKKHQKLKSYGTWLQQQEFMAVCTAIPITQTQEEPIRRTILFQLLEHLNLLGIESFKMDSRDSLAKKKRHLNIYDQTTLRFLQRINMSFQHSVMTFHDDIEDFRFSMTDFVAWNVRRCLNKEKVNFLEYAEGKIEIFIVGSERDRGRPLPLLGNWSTSSY